MSDFGPLVSGNWLAAHHDEVRIVDVRWYLDGRSGLPGAEGAVSMSSHTAPGRCPAS